MFHIPEDLLVLALSNLPVKTLLRFRCVSKQWKCLIDSKRFIVLHLNNSIQSRNNLISVFGSPQLCSLTLDSIEDQNPKTNSTINQFVHPFGELNYLDRFQCIGSCNGLLCLMRERDCSLVICNPSTRKYLKRVVVPLAWQAGGLHSSGFGYDACTDDYKLVEMFCELDHPHGPYVLEIYSVKMGSWRRVQDCLRNVVDKCEVSPNGQFVLGSLHWFLFVWIEEQQRVGFVCEKILVFDFKDEKLYSMSVPEHHSDTNFNNFGAINECLCLSGNDPVNNTFAIWVMKCYADEESWIKLVSIGIEVGRVVPTMKLVASSRSGREILLSIYGLVISGFLWYDLKNKSFNEECNFIDHGCGFYICDDTLVQPHIDDFISWGNDLGLGFYGSYCSENTKNMCKDDKDAFRRRVLENVRSMRSL